MDFRRGTEFPCLLFRAQKLKNRKENPMRAQAKPCIWLLGVLLLMLAAFASRASAGTAPLHDTLTVRCVSGDYHTIQAAVNAADGGDTIQVCAHTFSENVQVNDATKTPPSTFDGLHIVANGNAVLECPGKGPASGRGTGFELHASNVTIEGFNIEDCNIGISVLPNSTTSGNGGEILEENTICSNGTGISITSIAPTALTILNQNGHNSIVHNEICNNTGDGVFDFGAQGDYIFGNNVHDNGGNGIEISTTPNVTCAVPLECGGEYSAVIVDNEVEENGFGSTSSPLHGVLLNTANNVLVRGNRLSENANDGLHINPGSGSQVAANDADQNGNDGIELSSTASGNVIIENRMEKNTNFDAADHNGANLWINNYCATSSGFGTSPCVGP
jgi:parallel beta-helix repeat protein